MMRRNLLCAPCLMLVASLWPLPVLAEPIPIANVQRADLVQFDKDVLPILQKSCLACHNASEKQGDLILENPATMRKGGDTGPALIPGRGAESLLLKLAAHQMEPPMPPPGNSVNAPPLTSDELGLLRLWIDQGARGAESVALPSPKSLQKIPGTVIPVHAVVLTPDGQYAAASRGNQLFLYHVPTGKLVTRLSDPALNPAVPNAPAPPGVAHLDLIQSLAMNIDGDLLASGSFREIKIWKRPRDVQLQNLQVGGPVSAVAVSSDKKWIATSAANNTIQLWNAETGAPGPTLTGHTDKITGLTFSLNDTQVVSSSLDQTVRLWDVATGQPAGIIESTVAVNDVELVPTAAPTEQQPIPTSLLVTAGADNHLRTWTLPTAVPAKLPTSLAGLTLFTATPDRQFLAMSTPEGVVRVLKQAAPQPNQPPAYELLSEFNVDGAIAALALVVTPPPDAQTPPAPPVLAVSHTDGTVSLWKLPENTPLGRWRADALPLTALSTSRDGKLLATGAQNGMITLWNLAVVPPTPLEGTSGAPLSVTALSPSGSLLAVAGVVNGQAAILVWNLDTGKITHTLTGHEKPIFALAFSPDNNRLVSGSEDQTVRVWNLGDPTKPEQFKLAGHTATVTAVSFSADGNQVLSGSQDKLVKFWNLADGLLLKDFTGHTEPILAVGVAANGQLFSVSTDRTVRFWNPADGAQIRAFNDQSKPLAAALRLDRQRLAVVGEDKQVRIYQLDNGQLLQTLPAQTGLPTAVSFSQDGKKLVAAMAAVNQQPGETWVWDVEANPPKLLESFSEPALTLARFGKEPERLLAGTQTGTLGTRPLRFVRQCPGNSQPISALLFHSNNQLLFATARDGSFRGYNITNGQQTFATGHGAQVNALAISPNEQVLATAGENNQVRLWQTNGGGFGPQTINGLPFPAKSVAFSPDGTKILAGTAGDKPVTLIYDLQTGQVQQRFSQQADVIIGLETLGTPEDKSPRVLSVSKEGLWVWSLHGIRQIPGHGGQVTSLARLPGTPNQVFSGSLDTTIRRWNLENGQQLGQYNHGGAVVNIAVRQDGQRLASVSDNHTAKLWNVNGQQLAEMRGDVRLKTRVARLTQQQNAGNQRVNVARQKLDAAEKDVPVKTEADKKASEAFAAANKDVQDKMTALQTAMTEKVNAEKAAIEASTLARNMLLAKTQAELAAKQAADEVPVSQQRVAQVQAASNASPTDENLKKAVTDAQQAVTAAQQKAQQLQQAVQAPTQAAQQAVTAANQATEKVNQVQRPYNDALAAVRTAQSTQNLASQQQVIAARELKEAQALVPVLRDELAKAEANLAEVQKLLATATTETNAADLALRTVAFSPDGTILATAGDFPSVQTWDAETGAALDAFAGHAQGVSSLVFLDGNRIVSGSLDQTAKVWEVNSAWRLERTIGGVGQPQLLSDRVLTLDFSDDSTKLLAGGGVPSRNGELHLFNVADGNRIMFLPQAHDDVIYCARFSPDGKRIASVGADKYLRTFELASSQQLRRFEGHTNYVLWVAWKGDGQTLASASADMTVKVWNAETADQIQTIPNYTKHVTGVEFIGETDNIVSSSGDKLLRMHNAFNGGNFRNFSGPAAWLHCVDITPDGNVVATGSANGFIYLWNSNNGQQLKTLEPLP